MGILCFLYHHRKLSCVSAFNFLHVGRKGINLERGVDEMTFIPPVKLTLW